MNAPAPKQVALTVDEARVFLAKRVDEWVALMREHRLTAGSFRLDSEGLHDARTTVDVGLHVELLESRGCQVISHSVALLRVPGIGGQPQDKTVTSLLVRAPKQEN